MIEQENDKIMNNISIQDILLEINKKQEKVSQNDDKALMHSKMIILLTPVIILPTILFLNHQYAQAMLAMLISTVLGYIATQMICQPFEWVKKLFLNKKYIQEEKELILANQALKEIVIEEEFQFYYLASLEITLSQYDKKEKYSQEIIQKVQALIECKKNIIFYFQEQDVRQTILWIKKIESKITDLKNVTQVFNKRNENRTQFIEKYQNFLDKNELSELIQEKVQIIETNDFKKLI